MRMYIYINIYKDKQTDFGHLERQNLGEVQSFLVSLTDAHPPIQPSCFHVPVTVQLK